MELWLHHLCLFAGCDPAPVLSDDTMDDVEPRFVECEPALEDA